MQKKILIYNSGGGLGDSIQLFPLILSLQEHYKGSDFYYLGSHENHFLGKLKEFEVKIKSLEFNLRYFGFRWWHFLVVKNYAKKLNISFDIIIDLQSKLRNTLILKTIPHSQFYSSTFKFLFSTTKNNYISNDNLCDQTLENLNIFFKTKIKRINYNLSSLSKIYKEEAKKLLPNTNYIGFSITQGNVYRKKNWPLNKFIKLANKIKEKNKIPVFLIEKDNINLIKEINSQVPNAIFPEQNSLISCPALVAALGSRLDRVISIDNGIMHMLSLSNVKLTVLFGPTNSKKFAPSKNTTIIDSNYLYKSDDISKIEVDDVFNTI